jgi:hypothetical protein
MNFPNDENGDVLRRMHENGTDLNQPRKVDFIAVFPDEVSARTFGTHFAADNIVSFERTDCAEGLPWDVKVTRKMVPTHQAITDFEKMLAHVASGLGGRNDGWGTLSEPSGDPSP